MYEWISLALIDNPLFLLIPVGIIGLWRWGVWLIRRLIGLRYRAQAPEAFTATASIITPVYNENTTLFLNALESWAQENPLEIIAVIDHSDTACIEKFKEFTKTFAGARLIVTPKPGKRAALVDGIAAATGDIVVLVDSDTIWEQGVLAKVVTPFKDPRVGGVGTRQNVLKPQSLAQRLFDIHLDSRYFDEIRFLAAAGDAVTCLSGRTAAYRRSAVLPLLDDLVNETFFGKPVISGDDKRLTHLVQAAGWRACYQENARVFTPGSPKMSSFLKQRLRWTRNSWRADLRAMYDGWVWKKPALAFHLVDRLFQPVTTLIAPTYFLIALYRQNWRIVLLLLAWWLVSRTAKILPHIRRQPSSITMVPAYIFFSYVFAVFKLFAFFTMNEQGWITRWHSNRLKRVKRIRLAPAYGATLSVVLVLAVSMVRVDTVHQERVYKSKFFQLESNLPGYNLEHVSLHVALHRPPGVEVGASDTATGYISYRIGAGDTSDLLSRKYGFDPDRIVNPSGIWEPGERLYIPLPFKDYKAYREGIVVGEVPAEVFYVPESNTIVISGYGAAIDIPTLHKMMDKDAIIEYEGEGVYFLKASIFLERHTLLVMEAPEMSWLKMKSDADGHVAISSVGGGIWVDGIKVSSWDATANDYDKVYEDGRSFLLIRNARMDIVNAEVGYLGYSLETSGGDGGVYGLSWRITDEERFGRELTTGYLENSRVHHNYFGMYSFGATGMVIRNNEVFGNDQYGLDPHDDSNNFIVEHNYIHDNGNHGIIFSKRCFNNVIRWNRSENNVLHGIMLDRQSNNNSVYENVLVGNKDGVALWDSHNNDIYNNEIIASQRGVRLNRLSSYNLFRDNRVIDSTQYGLYIYDEAHNNVFQQNNMEQNEVGVYIRSTDNFIFSNRISGSGTGVNLTDESAANQIFRNRFEHNSLAMYLKTRPDDYVIDNIFAENEENIKISPLWRSIQADWLADRPERLVPQMTLSNSWRAQLPASPAITTASNWTLVRDNSTRVVSNQAKPAPAIEPTAAATVTAVPPTPTPKPTATPLATPTVAPPATATPLPALSEATALEPEWLRYLNQFRSEANLPLLVENSQLSEGSRLHSLYMVKTNSVRHDENSRSSWYTEAGRLAAENGTIFADPWEGVSAAFMINYWLSTPFSLVPIIDPELHAVGFGMYREASGRVRVAGTLNVDQGLGDLPATVTYPLPFPRDGGQTWILGTTLDESPPPLSNCSGYRRVTGPPIVLQIGAGDRTPNVTEHTFRQGETLLDHCVFDETTYINPEPFLQEKGRLILDQRDAIVLVPRKPLESGETYTVTIVESGVPFTWSFAAISPPE